MRKRATTDGRTLRAGVPSEPWPIFFPSHPLRGRKGGVQSRRTSTPFGPLTRVRKTSLPAVVHVKAVLQIEGLRRGGHADAPKVIRHSQSWHAFVLRQIAIIIIIGARH